MSLDPKSQSRLAGAHVLLRQLFTACASDPQCPKFCILESQRGRAAQERAFALGHSRAHFGQSAHNWTPAVALDVVPFAAGKAIDWEATVKFKALAAFVQTKARGMGIQITWGGTFPKLVDMPHYELADWETIVKLKGEKLFNG